MTVQEMIVEVWDAMGRDTDLNPYSNPPTNTTFDIATTGSVRILAWLNRGYRALTMWKLKDGRHIRFAQAKAETEFTFTPVEGTAQTAGSTSITLEAGEVASDDLFNGWTIRIESGTGSGQVRTIIDSTSGTDVCDVNRAWDTNPDDTSEYLLTKSFFRIVSATDAQATHNIVINPVTEFVAPEVLRDLTNYRNIPLAPNMWDQSAHKTAIGNPAVFFWDQARIWFDRAPSEWTVFQIEYARMLPAMTAATEEPNIPEPWHTCIVYWALHEAYRRKQESGEAWAVKNDLNDMIERLVQEREMQYDKQYGVLEVDHGNYY